MSGQPGWSRRAAERGLFFRPVAESDLAFLAALYASTRAEEVAPLPWGEAEKQAFLRHQFEAQHRHYLTHYAAADRFVIEHDGRPVGRLYLERWAEEHRIVDVALMPAARGRGLGAAVLQDLMDEAAAAGKAVSIHVEHNNPALRLYRRLGFAKLEDKGVYWLMAWRPEAQVKTAS